MNNNAARRSFGDMRYWPKCHFCSERTHPDRLSRVGSGWMACPACIIEIERTRMERKDDLNSRGGHE